MLTIGVSPNFELRSVTAVTGVRASLHRLAKRTLRLPVIAPAIRPRCVPRPALTNASAPLRIGDSVHPLQGPPMTALLTTNLGTLPLLGRGKVRDLYAVDDALLLVATDRISAFDHVLATGIPGKGKILTQISLFWFDLLSDLVPNHLIARRCRPSSLPSLHPYADQLEGRSMLVRRAAMFPVECVARGYLAGSGWKEYSRVRHGLRHSTARRACRMDRNCLSRSLRRPPRARTARTTRTSPSRRWRNSRRRRCCRAAAPHAGLYAKAARHAEERGLILADTKFEFGRSADRDYPCR